MHKHAVKVTLSKACRQAINNIIAQQDSLFVSNSEDSLAFECCCFLD